MTTTPKQFFWFAAVASAAAALGNLIVLPSGHDAAVAPLGGLLLAALLATERRTWPYWLVIAMVADLLASVFLRHAGWLPAAGDGLGHAGGVLATAWLARRACGMPLRVDVSRHVAFLAVFTILPGAALSASVDMLVSVAQGQSASSLSWLTLCSGYALSGLIVAPLLLAARQACGQGMSMSAVRGLEAAAVAVILCATLHVIFTHQRPLMYVALPVMLWIALRFGTLGMTLALVVFAVVARYYTAIGLGPYAAYPAGENVLLVQSFLVLASISGLLLAAITAERTRALGALQQARDALDTQVNERTLALRESEQRLRAVLDAIPDEVRLKDKEGRYLMLNRAAQIQMGLPESDIIGKTVYELRPPEAAARVEADDKLALSSSGPIRVDREAYVAPLTWREAILTPMRDASGTVTGLVSMSRDVTGRKLAEMEALREREERYRMLVEMASDVIYRTDHKGCFTYFNSDVLLRRYGFTREQLIGKHYLDLVHPDYRAQTGEYYQQHFKSRAASCYHEFPIIAGDGRTVWVGQHVNTFIQNNRIVYHQAVCRDISERVAAQQALHDTNEKLRQLSARQEELLEAERTRIAHDLHDGIGQSLNLVRIRLESAIADAAAGTGACTRQLREITGIIDQTNAAIRSLEFDLSPPVLRELGLTPALEWLAEDMRRAYGLRVGISDDGEPKALNPLSRAIAFRTVRELLINVVRHAGVMQAHVDVQRTGGHLLITVSDEGSGFDVKVVADGLGLVSVRERLGFLGGSTIIDSTPGEGTVATLRIPLADVDAGDSA